MGAGASQGFVEAADDKEMEMPDAPEHLKALASRLSRAHGVSAAIICQGLVVLEPCVQRRLNRRITKPLDLACLRAFKAEMEGQDVAPDVRAALDQLPDKAKVEALLDSLHLCGGYLPRIGLGSGGLYKHFEEGARPHEYAYNCGCRMWDCSDPVPAMPFFHELYNRKRMASQMGDKDLSDFVLIGHPDPWSMGAAPGNVRRSFEKQQEILAPMKREGEPLIDVYAPFSPARFENMAPDCSTAFDEVWKECESLYREGKVRALGVCNISAPQLERLLAFCEIRPAVYEAESHICHQQDAVVEICRREKIAMLAHTPLGQGTVLDNASLSHDSLSPAQCGLRFNLDRGVSVLPGAEKLSEIEEDQATPLGPPVARPPKPAVFAGLSMAAVNKEIYALIAPTADMVERDGHWYALPAKIDRSARKEVLAQNTATIEQIRPIIAALQRKAAPADHRKIVSEALAKLGGLEDKDRKLGSMMVIPAEVFASRDSIPRRSCKDEGPTPQIDVTELPDGARVIFFSQRWLTVSHPDDDNGTKRRAIVDAARAYAKQEGVDLEKIYIWFDLACVEQDDLSELVRGVNALGLFITACDAFVSIDHPEYWGRAWCLVEQEFARCAGVPRYVISSDGTLAPTSHDVTDPRDGNLTVEDDRAAIDVLCLVANELRSRLYLSGISQWSSKAQLDEAIGNQVYFQEGVGGVRSNIMKTWKYCPDSTEI